jgi:formate hydrogenlyase subunit 3/multisubunit Na+/H+ antiporter MnhD subunit
MIGAETLLVAALAGPLAMLAACLSRRARARMPGLLALAPLPALAAALLAPAGTPLVLFPPPFRMVLTIDRPAAMLLGAAALLWIVAGIHASASLRSDPHAGRFAEWWLLTLTGSIGVFVTADLVSFYLAYSVVSLAAYGLVAHDGTADSRRAGIVYLVLAILGEAFLLMAFVLLADAIPTDGLLIRDAVAALPASPWRAAALALLLLGFGLKIGLAPGHVWMPLAYRAAPIPAAAALSGAAVKAGIIGLIRFLPLGVAMPGWGIALATVGMVSAFYGVAVGITQDDPKTVLAYSSVSQMGLLAAALGLGWAAGDGGTPLGVSFAAANHILVKGALFLAVGVAAAAARRPRPVLLPAAILALGLAGLPLTGGMLGKLAIKAQFGTGLAAALAALSAAASALLMLHFLRRLMATGTAHPAASAPAGFVWSWLVAAILALAVPWAIFPLAGVGSRSAALDLAANVAALWPILLGASLHAAAWRWRSYLPALPAGDLVVIGGAASRRALTVSEAIEHADAWLRQWPVACLSLLGLAILLGAAMLASR